MNLHTTVCQMTWSTRSDGDRGLVFSDELADDEGQAFGYWLPLLRQHVRAIPFEFPYFELPDYEVYFPCTFRGDEIELAARMTSTELSFEIDGTVSEVVAFELNLALKPTSIRKSLAYIDYEKYIGSALLSGERYAFVEVLPVDIDLMNELFREHQLVFVGQTSSFGRRMQSLVSETKQ